MYPRGPSPVGADRALQDAFLEPVKINMVGAGSFARSVKCEKL